MRCFYQAVLHAEIQDSSGLNLNKMNTRLIKLHEKTDTGVEKEIKG